MSPFLFVLIYFPNEHISIAVLSTMLNTRIQL